MKSFRHVRNVALTLVAVLGWMGIPLAPPVHAALCTSVNAVAAPPVVSGVPQVGVMLTTSNGGWTNSPTSFTYKWYGNGTVIAGATASTYTPVVGDVGHTIASSVIATNAGGASCESVSASTTAVAASTQTTTTVFSDTLGATLTGISGYLERVIIHPAALTSAAGNKIAVSINFATTTSGAKIDGAWIGEQGTGNAYNFDGNQVQLTFNGGSTSSSVITGASTVTSDFVPFTYDATKALIVSVHFLTSGTETDLMEKNDAHVDTALILVAQGTEGVTAPTGTWDTTSFALWDVGVSLVQVQQPAPGAITNVSVPVITGTAQVGQTLTSTTGVWSITTGTTYAYQWNRAGVAIAGATSSTYVPVTADVGNALTVTVTATNATLSASATSAATASVIAAAVNPPVNTALPAITGTAQVGSTLTVSNGTWTNTPTGFTYQWNTSGGGAASVPFLLALTAVNTADQGFQLREVIPSTSLSATGTVAGQIRVGFTFASTASACQVAADIGELAATGNAWDFDGNQVPLKFGGATTMPAQTGAGTVFSDYATFTLNASKNLVIAAHYTGTTCDLATNGPAVAPAIYYSNTATDQTATAPAGLSTQLASAIGASEVDFKAATTAGPIPGAIASSYVPVTGDIGNTLTATVTASNGGGQASATSLATAAVTAAPGGIPVNTALPTISPTTPPQVGQLLTASNGTWTNTPIPPYLYQWNTSGGGAIKNFSVSGGKVIAPDGSVFVGRGIKIISDKLVELLTALPATTPLTNLFPGINIIQLFNDSTVTFAQMQPYINALTAKGIVVVLQDNPVGPTSPPLSGTALTNSVNVIANYAQFYKNNPYVWFTTQNEPSLFNGPGGTYNLAAVDAEEIAYYNGVRATGNNSMVVISATGNPDLEVMSTNETNTFSPTTNVVWDTHFYNFNTNFSADLPTNLAEVAKIVNIHDAVTNSNGAIPVMILEYGDNTTAVATNPDAGWMQVVQAVNTAPNVSGTAGYTWDDNGAPGDQLGADRVHGSAAAGLSAYGNLVAGYIASGHSALVPPTMSGPITGAINQTYTPVVSDVGNTLTVSVIAKNGTGSSSAATSLPTSAVVPAVGHGPPAARTHDLLSTLGISGHVGNYTDNSHTVADAAYLGIGKWRDGISGLTAATKNIYQGLVNNGVQIIGLPWLPTDNTFAGNVAGANAVAAMGTFALFAVEGPNEPFTCCPFTYNGFNSTTTAQGVSQWANGFYTAMKNDATLGTTGLNTPVATTSLAGGEPNNWGIQYLVVPAGPPAGVLAAAGLKYADWYNLHIYPLLDGFGSAQWIDPVKGDDFVNHENADFVSTYGHGFAGSTLTAVQATPRIITETNLQTAGAGTIVDKPTQGKNLLNGFMNAWNESFSAFCIYTFYPFSGDGTELFSGPGAPYISGTYIHNFTTILADTGATAKTFTPGSVAYTLSGLPSTAKSLTFEKSNGNFEIVIWNNITNWNIGAGTPIAIAPTTVNVNFPVNHGTLNVYDPTSGTTPAGTVSNMNVAGVQLRDYPVVVEVIN